MSKKYTIGTRGSLLALTQCNQVKDELEALTGDQFELKVITTQGDQMTDKPLWQLDGKDFFTKELDEQLLNQDIDMVVHSYKDLGSDRPEGIHLAAITKRNYGHDILLIKKETIAKLSQESDFIVGTSSPRRIVNIEKKLQDYLPFGENLSVKTKMLRGNVNTRIQKLRDGNYHAIVLALPGIERLALTESSRIELQKLLKDFNFMVLPHSDFPAAASQGALAIECLKNRDDQDELLTKLEKMKCKKTISEVSRERAAFQGYGGGCHLAVGIHVRQVGDHYLHIHSGEHEKKTISEKRLEGAFPTLEKASHYFLGLPPSKMNEEKSFISDQLIKKVTTSNKKETKNSNLYATSTYCLEQVQNSDSINTLWCAGNKSWKELAAKGLWVNGSSDGLGDSELKNLIESKAIQEMTGEIKSFEVLTNDKGSSTLGEVTPCYTREVLELTDEHKSEILNCSSFFWTSFFQYQTYTNLIPEIKDRSHCCGLGKTYTQFKDNGLTIRAFVSAQEYIEHCQKL